MTERRLLSNHRRSSRSQYSVRCFSLAFGVLLLIVVAIQVQIGRSLSVLRYSSSNDDEHDQLPLQQEQSVVVQQQQQQQNATQLSLHERVQLRRASKQKQQQQQAAAASSNNKLRKGLTVDWNMLPEIRGLQSPSGGAFIHMGKTGGSAISLLLRNGCHSFLAHPCRQVQHETMASKLIESYYHVPDFAFLQQSHHDFYFISTRDPFDRLVSAFVYQHILNIDARGDIDIKDRRDKYAIASSCFDSLESFVLFLQGNHSDFHYPYKQYMVIPEPCQDFARAVFHGRVRIFTHLFFSFERILGFVPNITKQVIYASRQVHLWDDWIHINRLLGQTTPIHIPDIQQQEGTHVLARNNSQFELENKLPITRSLSPKAVEILCQALQQEYNAYFMWLQLAKNINANDYDEEVLKVQQRCPMIVVAPYDHNGDDERIKSK